MFSDDNNIFVYATVSQCKCNRSGYSQNHKQKSIVLAIFHIPVSGFVYYYFRLSSYIYSYIIIIHLRMRSAQYPIKKKFHFSISMKLRLAAITHLLRTFSNDIYIYNAYIILTTIILSCRQKLPIHNILLYRLYML